MIGQGTSLLLVEIIRPVTWPSFECCNCFGGTHTKDIKASVSMFITNHEQLSDCILKGQTS